MSGLTMDNSARRQRVASLILAGLLGCLLMATLTLPAGHAAGVAADAGQYDRVSGPLGDWLADQLRNRPSLRTKGWNPSESEEWPDSGDPLALLRAYADGRNPLATPPAAPPTASRLRLALLALISPRGPPA